MFTRTLKATGRRYFSQRDALACASDPSSRRGAPPPRRRQRFFKTDRATPERRHFSAEPPHVLTMNLADGRSSPTAGAIRCVPDGDAGAWLERMGATVGALSVRAAVVRGAIAVLAFDHVAHGASPGDQATLRS